MEPEKRPVQRSGAVPGSGRATTNGGTKLNGRSKKKQIDPDALGLWECCEPGVFHTPHGRCGKCGKTAKDRLSAAGQNPSAGIPQPKPESDFVAALDLEPEKQDFVPRNDAEYIVVFYRGYTGIPLDGDNLVASFKALRDAVSDHLLKTASDAEKNGLQWEYRQFKGKGTKIAIYRREIEK